MKAKVTLTFNIQEQSELDMVKAIFGEAGGQDPSKPDSVEVAEYLAAQDWIADPIVVEE